MNSTAFRPRRFDLIAFDWDGTLFDSTALITRCIQLAVQDVGGTVPSDKDASYVIGMGLMQALAHAAPDVPADKYPLLGARYKHHYSVHQNDITLFAGVLEMLVFAMVDPQDLHWFGQPLALSRQGVYTLAFFAFWIITMASSALTTLLAMSPFELNRCPVPEGERPDDCRKTSSCS